MCCFSRDVTFVKNTRIFARPLGGGIQGVAYQMKIGAPDRKSPRSRVSPTVRTTYHSMPTTYTPALGMRFSVRTK